MSTAKKIIKNEDQLLSKIKSRFLRRRSALRRLHGEKVKRTKTHTGGYLAMKRTEIVDELVRDSFEKRGITELKNVAIIALGGYGRSELCPFSDIDLLFLYKTNNKTLAKNTTECLLYLLWDLNLDVGHSVRTIDECIELSRDEDTTILSSLLDSRFVFGDYNLYQKLDNKIYKKLLPEYSGKFIEKKIEENEKRIERFGRSVYLLEPNVKEGEGGIREINYALWIAQAKFKVKSFRELLEKGLIIEKDLGTFEKGLNFLLLVRSELHYLADRLEDRLGFEYQERIAQYFGFKDAELPAVERFMRLYYLRGSNLTELSKKLIEKCTEKARFRMFKPKIKVLNFGFCIQDNMLSVTNAEIFNEDIANLMRAFEYSDKLEIKMSNYLIDLIRDKVDVTQIDDSVRTNKEFNASFLRILKKGKNVAETLLHMNRLRLLGYFIPEFGKIVCMVQHDAYHVFTVDIHSIFMIREIEDLLRYKHDKELPLLTKTAESLMKRDVLFLACLFHDMGKGEGRNHAQKGAAMIPKLSKRMGLREEDSKQLEFLVKHHLIMTHFSQRRDIHDISLILRFARSVKTLETLSLLYLLTYADIRSVGPEVWTNWKAMLLKELFVRTASVLEKGEFQKEKPRERKTRIKNDVYQTLKGSVSKKAVNAALNKMPLSYFTRFSPSKIAQHTNLIANSDGKIGMNVIFHEREQYDEFTFWGFDAPGIFSKLCGVIRANGLNILGARITTRADGRILDVFYVNHLGKSTHDDKEIWDKLEGNLTRVVDGKINVEKLMAKRKKIKHKFDKNIPLYPTRIEVDNESSDISTVIDVYTYDRNGLLYDITKTITKLDLSIESAKISTKVDQVVDAFYVNDMKGNKIEDPEKIDEIKVELFKAITGEL